MSALLSQARALLGLSWEWLYRSLSVSGGSAFQEMLEIGVADGILSWLCCSLSRCLGCREETGKRRSCHAGGCLVQTPAGFRRLLLQSEWTAALSSEPTSLGSRDAGRSLGAQPHQGVLFKTLPAGRELQVPTHSCAVRLCDSPCSGGPVGGPRGGFCSESSNCVASTVLALPGLCAQQ